ncbi:dipeptidase [Bacillus marinisedimentorum]|uniref:dipeptidase n=1 Tax=Bacillus marinisedimentorum TaxID=1821260 RepID=UPI0007E28B13|nr:dipeptidase [Bacillus marinisedimentorum]
MKIFDAHCDVLLKMRFDPAIRFKDSSSLHTNLVKLKKSNAFIQVFAIYIPEQVPYDQRFLTALEMADLFHSKILGRHPEMKAIQSRKDIEGLKEGEIGAVLALEGCDAIGSDPVKLKTLLRLGVSSVGLTWNYANQVADGILESRGAGLSAFGVDTVNMLNEARVWTDVSHLSVNGFWDVMDAARYPIASHSNAKSLCGHVRNLEDDQIEALIRKDGMIGITFVPDFLNDDADSATIDDVIRHLDHVCSLGGADNVGFGSDFDGIGRTPLHLDDYGNYSNLIERLINYYSNDQVDKFTHNNFINHFPR